MRMNCHIHIITIVFTALMSGVHSYISNSEMRIWKKRKWKTWSIISDGKHG